MERGVTVPASRQERFYTLHDNQRQVEIVIYQGEGRLVRDNIRLGRLTVTVLQNEAIDVRFTYTIDGIPEVAVTVVSNGEKENMVIEEAPGVLTPEQIQRRLAELSELKVHPRDKIENRTLLARRERLHETHLQSERRMMAEAMFQFESAIDSRETKSIVSSRQALEALLNKIEKRDASS